MSQSNKNRNVKERMELIDTHEYRALAEKEYLTNGALQDEFRSFGVFYHFKRYKDVGGNIPVKKNKDSSTRA